MAATTATETAQVAISSTDNYATFQGAQTIHLIASADCYIDIDQPAVTSRSFLLKANTEAHPIEVNGSIMKVHVIGTSGTLYILAVNR